MSSSSIVFPQDQAFINNNNIPIIHSKKSMKQKIDKNSKINRKMTKVSQKIRPESALMTMISLIIEHRNQISVVDSVLSINAEDLDLVQKLNYCMEFLAHIPFSFQYNKTQTKILLDFFHLEEEMNLITNLEI